MSINFCAQDFDTKVDQNQSWLIYNGVFKINNHFNLQSDIQIRRWDGLKQPQQNLYRIGFDYNFNEKISATVGWAYVETFPYGEFLDEVPQKFNHFKFSEQRLWEQIALKHNKMGNFLFDSRFRIEQRWLENIKNIGTDLLPNFQKFEDKNEGFWRLRHRLRYRLRLQFPLFSSEWKDNILFATLYNEVMINFGKGVTNNIFDQNRLSATLGWRFNKDANIQLGYLNQFIQRGDGAHKENNHTLQLSLNYNFDLSKLFSSKNETN